jgi:hypothetical protein
MSAIKRRGLIAVEDKIFKEDEFSTIIEAAWYEDWKVNGQAHCERLVEEATARMDQEGGGQDPEAGMGGQDEGGVCLRQQVRARRHQVYAVHNSC